MDPMEALTAATQALNDVATRAAGYWDDADAQILSRQQAYDALANDLRNVVKQEMYWQVTLDPNSPEVTGDGGSYQTLSNIFDDAPRGCMIEIEVLTGQTYELTAPTVAVRNQFVRLFTPAGQPPGRLRFPARVDGNGHNQFNRFALLYGSGISFENVELEMMPKADPVAIWAALGGSPIVVNDGQSGSIGLEECAVFGSDGAALFSLNEVFAALTFKNVAATGDLALVGAAAQGTGAITTRNVTLSNGAVLRSGGVVGTNVLEN